MREREEGRKREKKGRGRKKEPQGWREQSISNILEAEKQMDKLLT